MLPAPTLEPLGQTLSLCAASISSAQHVGILPPFSLTPFQVQRKSAGESGRAPLTPTLLRVKPADTALGFFFVPPFVALAVAVLVSAEVAA